MPEKKSSIYADYTKGFEDAARLNKDATGVFVAAAEAVAKAYGEIGANWLDYTSTQFEENTACAKAVLASKTPKEAIEVQTAYAKKAFDQYVATGAKLSEVSLRTANEIIEPVGAQFNQAFDNISKSRPAA
jgi:phasin family protein